MLYEAPDAPEPSLYMPIVKDRPDATAGAGPALLYGAKVLKVSLSLCPLATVALLLYADICCMLVSHCSAYISRPPTPIPHSYITVNISLHSSIQPTGFIS